MVRSNIAQGKTFNFVKYDSWLVDSRKVEYDYGSIMHYRYVPTSKVLDS